jgi:hypothetical protein
LTVTLFVPGFFTSGADLLRRTLTGDSERQAMKTHSKNKRSKMALSRSERKVNFACREFGFGISLSVLLSLSHTLTHACVRVPVADC